MHKLAQIALGLTLGVTMATTPLSAQSGMKSVPVPGPYQIIIHQQPMMPAFTPQRYVMPIPYWMQNTQQPRATGGTVASGSQTTQAPAAVGRTEPQPLTSGWNAAPQAQPQQGYRAGPTPGYFPGYAPGNTQTTTRPPQPAPNYAPAPWGQQGFMPMQAPWQNGWNQNGGGQNGWNNNWNNSGYGNRQGFAAPMMPRQ